MSIRQCVLAVIVAAAMSGQPDVFANELVEMPAPPQAESFDLEFVLEGRTITVGLEANRAPFASLDDSLLSGIHAGGNRFFRGVLPERENAWARLSWVNGRWSGVLFDGDALFFLDRPPTHGREHATKRASSVALHRVSELDFGALDFGHEPGLSDGTQVMSERVAAQAGVRTHGGGASLPITIVSDTQFSARHGGNVLGVIASRVNTIDGLLSAEVGTGLSLMHHRILGSNGSLTANTCFDLRQQFQNYFLDGAGSDIPFAGVAHLVTGRSMTGPVGCVQSTTFGPCTRAFSLGVVKEMPQEWQSIAVMAHELGHNLGSPHDAEPGSACAHEAPGRLMAPDGGTSFTYSACSVGLMRQRLESAACLLETGLFHDGFELH